MQSGLARHTIIAVLMSAALVVSASAQSIAPVGSSALPPLRDDAGPPSQMRHDAAATLAPSFAASLPDDALWEGFLTPGLSSSWAGAVGSHFTEYRGQLVIWGDIDAAGSQAAGGVVLWDGSHFEPLPPIGSVRALTVWNDQIVAATYDFSTNSYAILRFDGAQWDTLGVCSSGVTGATVFDGRLVVVGRFTSVNGVPLNRVAAFDGVAWSGFGSGFPSSESPSAVVTHGGTLIVGMDFGSQLGYIRAWDPVAGAWQPLGAGFNGSVLGLASDGVKLFAAGSFTASGATTIYSAGQWDGNAWSSIGLPASAQVASVTIWNGKAAFPTQETSGIGVGRMKVWDGLTLSTIPGDSLAYQRGYMTLSGRMLNHVGTWGTKLVASGTLFRNGSTPCPGVAVYDGTGWSSIHEPWGPGMQGLVGYATDMRVWSGRLVVAGPFGLAGAGDRFEVTPGVAAWDGAEWTGFAEGLGGNDIFLGEYNGDLVAAGWRLYVRTDPTLSTIARWDGTTWTGFGGNPLYGPTCIQQMHQDLYVADINGLHRWNGSAWSWGFPTVEPYTLALSTTGDSLVVGGDIDPNVGFWDGSSWLPAGAGVNDRVYAAALWNGRIVIGGVFSASGATPLPGVAVWDGAAWQPLGGNAVVIWRLRVIDGELYGTGRFRLSNGSVVETVARYIEPGWQLLGSGSNNLKVFDITGRLVSVFEGYQGQLYHGGSGIVHGHVAHNLSRRPLPDPVLGAPPPHRSQVALTVGPNPVQTSAHFKFALGSAGWARLTIIDVAGREVATVMEGPLGAGPHDLHWAARCAPGVYFARLRADGVTDVVRFVRLKSE